MCLLSRNKTNNNNSHVTSLYLEAFTYGLSNLCKVTFSQESLKFIRIQYLYSMWSPKFY
jgi:hypothetical protein